MVTLLCSETQMKTPTDISGPSSASSLLSHVLCCKIWPRWPPWTVLSQFSKTCSLGLGFLSEWIWYHPVVPVTPCLRLVRVISSPFPRLPEDKFRSCHSWPEAELFSFWLKIFPFHQVLFPLKALSCFTAPCSCLFFISKIVRQISNSCSSSVPFLSYQILLYVVISGSVFQLVLN